MPSKLCKWGSSLGVRLPQYITERTEEEQKRVRLLS